MRFRKERQKKQQKAIEVCNQFIQSLFYVSILSFFKNKNNSVTTDHVPNDNSAACGLSQFTNKKTKVVVSFLQLGFLI
jgi:hypothetical protein